MGPIQTPQEVVSWLRRRWQIMVVALFLGAVGGVLFALSTERVYSASAVIQVTNPVIAVNDDAERGGATPDVTRRVQMIEQRLMSREALLDLAQRYNLFGGAPVNPTEQLTIMREAIAIRAIAAAQQGFSRDGSLSALVVQVDVAEAETAAAIANELAEALVALSVQERQANAQQTLDFFRAEEDRLEGEIGTLEAAISEYSIANEQYLPAAIALRREERARLAEQLLGLDQEISVRRAELAGLDATSRRAVTQRRITTLNDEIAGFEDQRRVITARVDEIQTLFQTAPAVEQQIDAANRRMVQLQAQLTAAADRRREAELGARIEDDQQSERFEILERALVPEYPVSTSRTKLALMGIVGGLGLGLFIAYALEWRFPVLRTAQRMERELQLRPVISIPYTEPTSEKRRRQLIWLGGIGGLVIGVLLLGMATGLI